MLFLKENNDALTEKYNYEKEKNQYQNQYQNQYPLLSSIYKLDPLTGVNEGENM